MAMFHWLSFSMGNGIYPLVLTNSLPWKDPPMFKNCKSSIFLWAIVQSKLLVYQRVLIL